MALVPFKFNNFLSESEDLITTQFEGKDVFNRYLRLLKIESQRILGVARDLMQKRDIDSATGAQLDIIGDIVGQPRTIVNADLFPFFGFQGNVAANSFGTVFKETVGGYWYSLGQKIGGDVTLSDDVYRMIIKAKIIKNNACGTNEDYIKFGNFVLNTPVSFETDEDGNAGAVVLIGRRITMFEKALMAYVFEGLDYDFTYTPKPLGVGIEVGNFDGSGTLGFLGTPGAKGMISMSYPFDGGVFADAYA